jgi:hypothetical protein
MGKTYTVSEEKLQELNVLIDKAGGQNTSEISKKHESVVAVANTLPQAEAARRAAIIRHTESAQGNNEVVGATLAEMQLWHNSVAQSDTSGGGAPPPTPAPGTTAMRGTPGANGGVQLKTNDKGLDVHVNGGNYGYNLSHNMWAYFQADADGDVASMSSDGGQVALSVTDSPADPAPKIMDGVGCVPNVAESRPYKKGQFVNMKIGKGGYSTTRAAMFSVIKYA